MMKLQIAVCDNDILFLQHFQVVLLQIAQKHRLHFLLRKFESGAALVHDCTEHHTHFDLIFLDAALPHEKGKSVAEHLRAVDQTFLLVFITAAPEEVFEMFDYDPAYFLHKQEFDLRMEHALLHLLNRLDTSRQPAMHCVVRDETGCKHTMRFALRDIMYLESVARNIFLYTTEARYHVVCVGFEQLKQDFLSYGLVETHRTCLINVRYLEAVTSSSVMLQNRVVLPLSRRKRAAVFSLLGAAITPE